ncbi:hypothetical protein OG413_41490 [Streptomyces sp. NBC_01433]|uniref:hypothetical protein n=1 Tax=Streptomyces sp. NBC_01433 TaxID=2903864 RepID=UPI002255A727|nr:hypothetical protein [Streptomyces sp. NBC_01433]MCX4681678.1 hypothetical protein [Streptomyces sp. NBC_01433]
MFDHPMLIVGVLLVLAADAIAVHGFVRSVRGTASPRRFLMVAVPLVPAALLFALAHVYWLAITVLAAAALLAGFVEGVHRLVRRRSAQPHRSAPRR